MAIRRIRPGGEIPSGLPARYRTSDGYVVLRWKVAPREYVEILEHRLVAGNPPGPVHHRDLDRTNNEPANLLPTGSAAEHGALHKRTPRQEAVRLYEAGLSTIEVAARLGTYPGNISRILRANGVTARRGVGNRRDDIDGRREAIADALRSGAGLREVARRFGCSHGPVQRIRDEEGIPARPPGRRPSRVR